MAAGNIIQGQGAGKLGDVVLMVRNGVQVARVYTKAGARSGSAASEASRIQRVRFGAASNQWALYRYICTRMYRKGKGGNQSDYNYFVKKNQGLLPYLTKNQNAEGVHCLMPGLLSEGSLGRIECILSLSALSSTSTSTLKLADSMHHLSDGRSWAANMAGVKVVLRAAYPAATKVTYLFSFAPVVFTESEGVEYTSQQIYHTPVTIELYKESRTGENAMTLAEYFASYFDRADIKDLISAQTGHAMTASYMLNVSGTSPDDYDLLKNMSVVIFATDDNASDCYSTVIPADGVPVDNGAYALYHTLRTSDQLRLACESYGFQSGVMRDDIAKFGNSLQQAQAAYAARLRSMGLDVEPSEE